MAEAHSYCFKNVWAAPVTAFGDISVNPAECNRLQLGREGSDNEMGNTLSQHRICPASTTGRDRCTSLLRLCKPQMQHQGLPSAAIQTSEQKTLLSLPKSWKEPKNDPLPLVILCDPFFRSVGCKGTVDPAILYRSYQYSARSQAPAPSKEKGIPVSVPLAVLAAVPRLRCSSLLQPGGTLLDRVQKSAAVSV